MTVLSNPEGSRVLNRGLFGIVLRGRAAETAPALNRIVSDLMA